MIIQGKDTDREVFVIAEIGNCHEGSVDRAAEMIRKAAKAGASAVKFQTIVPEKLVSPQETERVKQLNRICLKPEAFPGLKKVADDNNVIFLTTPFDLESVDLIDPLVPAYKIASGDNNFYPLIEAIVRKGKPVIISTGILQEEGIVELLEFMKGIDPDSVNPERLALLHCVVNYPVTPENAHIKAIQKLERFDVTPGYSDHTIGIEAAVAATVLGARVIEKHFTLDKNFSDFPDHKLSADPADLALMIKRIREIQFLLGSPELNAAAGVEAATALKVRRSIALGRDMKSGETISAEDLTWIRPGTGLPPGREKSLIGKVLAKDMLRGSLITAEDVLAKDRQTAGESS